MQKYFHYLLKAIEWTLFAGLLFFFCIIVSPLLPTKKYIASFAVISGSMEPTVPIGALALVSQTPAAELQKGDVIAFADPDVPKRTILHRIVESRQIGTLFSIKTKGDHNSVQDAWSISSSNVKGKMVAMIPLIGYPILWAQQPIGFMILVGIPALILIGSQIKNIYDGFLEEIEKKSKIAATSAA